MTSICVLRKGGEDCKVKRVLEEGVRDALMGRFESESIQLSFYTPVYVLAMHWLPYGLQMQSRS